MSLRGTKRATGVRSDEAGSSKRRRTAEPEDALWQLRSVSDLKMSSIYNRSASEAPAELFRKDLISAMKLPDSEPLTPNEYWVITDTWKQDWERGVQVPVNPDSLPAPVVKIIDTPLPPGFQEFKLPKDKYVHLNRDIYYQTDQHQLSNIPARAESCCKYDLDATDTAWLKLLNSERARAGAPPVTEDQLERVIEELEVRCWDKIQAIMKSEEKLGIEYDENVICDVCRSPDSEEGNEMVFCDSCNICVHQACYGITTIPSGQWLCRPCSVTRHNGTRPTCVLCPNLGGAMKCTPSGHKWAHVSCVLWIPEVSIGCAEKMEPITKISAIPTSRWSLVCILCRERKGACIQCSVKTCKTAYHVTCAFKHGLEMRAIIEDENADDGVKLRSYCQKHSVNSKKDKCPGSGSEDDEIKRKRRKDMTSEEKNQARAAKLQEIEREFDRHVSVKDISTHLLDIDQEAIYYIYNYWKLKRRSGHNRPLLPPKADDSDILSHRQEQADLDKMKMFVQLRQDLERVRNLCYMVSRREKLSRSFFRMREQTFHKQLALVSNASELSSPTMSAVVEANHGPSIYDRLYSHPDAADHTHDFDEILSRIAGDSGDEKKKDLNGLIKANKSTANPYKKVYVNGSSRRSGSMYSGLSSEESAPEIHRPTKYRNRTLGSSTDDGAKASTSPKKKISPSVKEKCKKLERKKRIPPSRTIIDSSSEEEIKKSVPKDKPRSNTLRQMEKEMSAVQSSTESDDLMPVVRLSSNNKFPVDIYSDSSESNSLNKIEEFNTDKSPNATNDSQQQLPRTKAAMKEFVPIQKIKEDTIGRKRGRKTSNSKEKVNYSDEDFRDKENLKFSKGKDYPSELIVPQRQAAKKASENMRSNTNVKMKDNVDQTVERSLIFADECKAKIKSKFKLKDTKDFKDKENPVKELTKKKALHDCYELEIDEKDPEPIAYVPQRQAAKKAAAHIKSGLGTKFAVLETEDLKKKENDKIEVMKKSPKEDEEKHTKTSSKSSSSSSSNSSSSSYSSTSSSEDDEKSDDNKSKTREIKPQTAKETTLFSPPRSRPTVDLPFLDKVSRPLSSTSASSDSDSSKVSRGSGSSTPSPKRIRPRRKDTNSASDAPRKAPDKKLKTSERRPECEHPTLSAQGKEPIGAGTARAATRARTRSTAGSGNMLNQCDSRQRKSSKDEPNSTKIKTFKESTKPSEFSSKEWKEDQTLSKMSKHNSPKQDTIIIEEKANNKTNRSSINKRLIDDAEKIHPPKISELKHKTTSDRRMSAKESFMTEEAFTDPMSRESNLNKFETHNLEFNKESSSVKITNIQKYFTSEKKISPKQVDDLSVTAKHWLPKAPSPTVPLPPVEKPGGNDKYITEDKSFDSDSADKSSVKMIAKIQATLNENMMIKSPKTPMDARTVNIEPIDVDMPLSRNVRKRSVLDTDKKFMTQDVSHVQGVEISKSAKIPSAVNSFANRGIFSPQPKDNELFVFDMLSVEDGFNHEEIIKPFTYPELFFKEDSKEDRGVQETLNLVEKLRMTLSSKKPPQVENTIQEEPMSNSDKITGDNEVSKPLQNNEDVAVSSKSTILNFVDKNNEQKGTLNLSLNRGTRHTPEIDVLNDSNPESQSSSSVQVNNNTKWSEIPILDNSRMGHVNDNKYIGKEYVNVDYSEDSMKNTGRSSTGMHINSEADRDNFSKQSDDSQPLSVVDHSMNSNDQESMSNDLQNYENNNSMVHSDCATISSPYMDSHEAKWSESKITHRRSSASSTDSDTSICSQKSDIKSRMDSCDSHQTNIMQEMDMYPAMPSYCSMEPIPLSQYSAYPPDASQYLSTMSPVSIFPPGTCGSSQLPLSSPGVGLFPSALDVPYNTSSLIPPIPPLPPKPVFPVLSAAFTSSSQNIALTTAMIAPPTPKPVEESPRDDIDIVSDKYPVHSTPSPTVSVESYNELSANRHMLLKQSDSSETTIVEQASETKSTSKPFKAMTKFMQQIKSPGKSPGISPKQNKDSSTSKRSTTKNNRGQRGKGRSKTRGHVYSSGNGDYLENSIQSKLVGTVYDFDEEIANDGVDLKALRERRKSLDVHEKKSEGSFKDASQSPNTAVTSHTKRVSQVSDNKEMKASTPVADVPATKSSPKSIAEHQNFAPVVQPVLPGPVDMRRYQPFETATTTSEPYHSHLLAFASGTADQQLADIDEEVEKQLHSALAASKPVTSPKSTAEEPAQQAINKSPLLDKAPVEMPLPKVSLSDSRNQLKVKIKGPFLDANYSNSSVQPVVPQPPAATLEPTPSMLGTPNVIGSSTVMSGTTNLRRMRKKELLRQYWTQDMNMDEPVTNPSLGNAPPPASQPLLTRAVITIPKAVASMTSIPTREDYRGVTESNVEKKKRRTTSGLSRELRHLEVSMNDDVDNTEETRVPSYNTTVGQVYSQKRRGRTSSKPNKPSENLPLAPKLKIKIGANFVQPVNVEESSGFQFRPPKKRLASMQKPTFEDLRRESMKYRRMVMAHFEEDEKIKKHKPKGEKRKKKKDKKVEKLQVVNSDSESATKLVIKIKRTKNDTSTVSKNISGTGSSALARKSASLSASVAAVTGGEEAVVAVADPFEYDPTAPDPLAIDAPSYAEASAVRKIRTAKVTPIRLKLARSAEGSGYVMKDSSGQSEHANAPAVGAAVASASQPLPLTVNKHCEVR